MSQVRSGQQASNLGYTGTQQVYTTQGPATTTYEYQGVPQYATTTSTYGGQGQTYYREGEVRQGEVYRQGEVRQGEVYRQGERAVAADIPVESRI